MLTGEMAELIKKNKLFFAVALAVILMRFVFSWLDMSFLLGRVVDDAFYYYQTARNIINGAGSTFDGINPTNGYHPLWMLCLLPIFFFSKGSPELSIHLVMTLQTIILAGIIFLSGKIIYKRFGAPYPLIALAFFLWPRYLNQTEYGVEAGLLILLFLFTVNYCIENRIFTSHASTGKNLLAGVIFAVVFLARLDSVFLFASVAIYLMGSVIINGKNSSFQNRIKIFLEKSVAFSIPVILITSPYLILNYLKFSHITPISGSLKHSFPVPSFHSGYFPEFREFALIFFIALIYLAVLLFKKEVISNLGAKDEYASILTILAMYVVLHFFDTIFFMKWAVFRWHFAGYVVFMLLVSPLIINALTAMCEKILKIDKMVFVSKVVVPLALVTAVSVQVISVKRTLNNKFQYRAYKEGLWIKENSSPDDIFMVEDAGIIAYFSERKVVNIDGVINNFELQDYLREGKMLQYIKDKGIKYFAHHAFWNNPGVRDGTYRSYLFRSFSHLYDKPGGDLVLEKDDEIYRSAVYDHFGDKTIFVIWKIDY